jgi:hypothetical protein
MAPRADQRPANLTHYWRNRDREIERVRARQASTLEFLRALRRVSCIDCGAMSEQHQMDFVHRDPTRKAFRLTAGAAILKSRQALVAEARECDVVSANSHRVRTWARHANRSEPTGASPYLRRARARWRAQAKLLDDLRDVPCQDCGRRFPPCAMDFDHRDPLTKIQAVTRMIGRSGTGRILAEAAKCDIVCANCHRLRTFERRLMARQARE